MSSPLEKISQLLTDFIQFSQVHLGVMIITRSPRKKRMESTGRNKNC